MINRRDEFTVLVIEDELFLRDAMVSYLNLEGVRTFGVADLRSAEKWLSKNKACVVVLDLTLGEEDGLEWFASQTLLTDEYVIISSARGNVSDRVKGLEQGVHAYLVKPIALEELMAMVNNIALKQRAQVPVIISSNTWILNRVTWTLTPPGEIGLISLTKYEEMLLSCLARVPGESVTKEALILAMGKSIESYDARNLEILVRRLRAKVSSTIGSQDVPIKTIHAVGYSFISPIELV